jgi:hypothetical protein
MHPYRILREQGNNTPEQVAELLAKDVEFYSPILTGPVTGRSLISRILALSAHVRVGHYVREHKLDERTTFLYWKGVVDGHDLESMELLEDDDHGLIARRTVAYRPFPAVTFFRSVMYENLKDAIAPRYWSYTPEDPATLPTAVADDVVGQ